MNFNKSIGICVGASTVSFVVTERNPVGIKVSETVSDIHEGNPRKAVQEYFADKNVDSFSVVVTGRKFKQLVNTHSIPEPQAIEEAFSFLGFQGKFGAIASLGGENFIVYCLSSKGHIDKVITGNKCASGTGEFFLQQIGRMNLSVEEAVKQSIGNRFYSVSGRCSVFCKSDCTHALNKGVEKAHVVSGLCKMIADKTIDLLSKQDSQKVLLIGGVSRNTGVVKYIKNKYSALHIPKEAHYFEALGASLVGLKIPSKLDKNKLFRQNKHSFTILEPLDKNSPKVKFKELTRSEAREGDECILGLDVGSTTTKAVIIRKSDNSLLASVYLRTNGNPVQASVECYKSLSEQINVPVKIIGLGTTGSGRHISALHALTKGVVNEIIAHAVAAAYFDKEVDTIFEIGGQDAKYTHLTNGIASDYAMNEACSAGTGSFLEEAAKESLNVSYTDIGDIAFTASQPLNFNDQCAAFISSDIKNASHDGAAKEDIVAGLVYSICMNYVNRVKGNRPVGKKVFMQGGVCYNRAVPYAMANLINKEIIVPPEPGLMGAFGVALEIKNRIRLGFIEEGNFDLNTLINREFTYGNEFICAGGKEKCDRKCKVAIVEIENKKYPFGGACSKYYNQRNEIKSEPEKHNYVKLRQELVFEKYCSYPQGEGKRIGISRSFLTNTLYPLYYNFFAKLGFHVVLPDYIDPSGIEKMTSSFCYPVEISHGFFKDLLSKELDYIFMPHITELGHNNDHKYKRLCVFVQGEPYYIRSVFKEEKLPELIQPIIDLSVSESEIEKQFVKIGKQLGVRSKLSVEAFRFAYSKYRQMLREFRTIGERVIKELENNPSEHAMVLFGRAYNAFAAEANLNIPHKFASKNITIIPHDFLPSEGYNSYDNMYWSSGQQIMKGARYVKEHEQLFGVFITNFSCGPDSFILSYFRSVMGTKPSLTLELDSHSADVGVETRIDAALDIIKNYKELKKKKLVAERKEDFKTLTVESKENKAFIRDIKGKVHSLTSEEVEIIIPSMGRFSTEAFSAICRSQGMNSRPLPVPTTTTLKYGRGLTTCKECLPFILTTGQLVEFIHNSLEDTKNVLFFMPHGYGPCRQGQYYIMLKDIIKKLRVPNVGVLSMDDESSFGDLGNDFFLKGWIALMIADVVHDIESVIQTLAVSKESALHLLETGWGRIINSLEVGVNSEIFRALNEFSSALSAVDLKQPLEEAKVVSLIGEIYVRREEFSRGDLINTLINNGFVVRTAPITEYIYYSNYLLKKGIVNGSKLSDKLRLFIKEGYQKYYENKIKQALTCNMYKSEAVGITKTMRYGNKLVSEKLVGETILTIGLALREILDHACGIISIGPFNCMPSRLSEAILNKEMTLEGKYKYGNIKRNGFPEELSALPFLYVETDGNPYPQITQSRLEIFMMQAEKVYKKIKSTAHVYNT